VVDMPRVLSYEIPAEEVERAARFFETVFGWQIEERAGPARSWLLGTPRAGSPRARRLDAQPRLRTIMVDDVDVTLEQVKGAGGEVVFPRHHVAGVGAFAYFADTEGNVWGLAEHDRSRDAA
jgi:uncharacterized protein